MLLSFKAFFFDPKREALQVKRNANESFHILSEETVNSAITGKSSLVAIKPI